MLKQIQDSHSRLVCMYTIKIGGSDQSKCAQANATNTYHLSVLQTSTGPLGDQLRGLGAPHWRAGAAQGCFEGLEHLTGALGQREAKP